MGRKNILIILIFALIVIGAYNFYHFSGRRNPRSASVVPRQRLVAATKKIDRNSPSPPLSPSKGEGRVGEKVKKFYFPDGWGRNPFLTPAEVKQLQTSLEKEFEPVKPLPDYVVTSILISDGQKVAVIDGKIVSPGDSIGMEIVKDISTDGVELVKDGNIRMIRLRQGSTGIKTRHLTPTLTLPPGGGGKGEGDAE